MFTKILKVSRRDFSQHNLIVNVFVVHGFWKTFNVSVNLQPANKPAYYMSFILSVELSLHVIKCTREKYKYI